MQGWRPSSLRFGSESHTTSVERTEWQSSTSLIVYSLREQRLVDFAEFGTDIRAATDAYAATEREYRDRSDDEDFEIVLLGADSLATIEQTHSRYFTKRETVPF